MSTTATAKNMTSTRPSDSLSNDTLIGLLHQMMLIREFEVRTMQAYSNAHIGGFCHVYTGQEACAVGTIACVNDDDPVITAYRDHGHALARGMDPKFCMAEMYGKITGCAKGKGGSMHMFDKPNWLFGGHGIVGAQTPVGAGLAFAARYEHEVMGKGKKKVCLCYLGDGALNQGSFHEAQNLAGLLDIPVIYIVENNGYSMGTSISRGTTMADDLCLKAKGYGIDNLLIEEGMDILKIYDLFKPFAANCRDKQRPGFVDLRTYRYHGHSMSDPQKYRSKDEVKGVQERDSIDVLKEHLIEDRKCVTEEEVKAKLKEIRAEVRESVKFAEESSEPSPDTELYSDVYMQPESNLSPLKDYTHGATNALLEEAGEASDRRSSSSAAQERNNA